MKHTPLTVDGVRMFDLRDLAAFLRSADPDRIQPLSDDDVFSSWLDLQDSPSSPRSFVPSTATSQR